jgi:hypothetical protein
VTIASTISTMIRIVSTFQKRCDVDLFSVMCNLSLEYGLNH